MTYSGLSDFIVHLEELNELSRVREFVDPALEITEIADRVVKTGGKALLFENNGTSFPVLINAFASDRRMAMAIGRETLDEAGREIEQLFKELTLPRHGIFSKLSALPRLLKTASYMPARQRGRGSCQQIIHREPDLSILPVLKCWPHDGGRFITLPMVHTVHPETGSPNVGMYRMQILGKNSTGMHWQRHKTGASHFEAWKKSGKRMPVTVTLGGDPVYTYAATAPLPENISEYILAGFLRRHKVKLVKCLTNNLYIPEDADIVLEGYVDPSQAPVWEGPFGDHTGFYSLADWYPEFHVTCITHRRNAIYPATIVGVPPMEDAWLAKATERLFLAPVKMALQPEVIDFHMPDAGIAHNLAVVRIRKDYPGQGMKVITSLFGAGQMMFTKYLAVVSGDVDIRDYKKLLQHIFENTSLSRDLLFCRGPLDVLDHSSDSFSFGGKLGIDATIKHPEELASPSDPGPEQAGIPLFNSAELVNEKWVNRVNDISDSSGIPVIVLGIDQHRGTEAITELKHNLVAKGRFATESVVFAVDSALDVSDLHMVAWQALGNADPVRDHYFLPGNSLFIDATMKGTAGSKFPRRWPNVVSSSPETIKSIDEKWQNLSLGEFIPSPSQRVLSLVVNDSAEVEFRS